MKGGLGLVALVVAGCDALEPVAHLKLPPGSVGVRVEDVASSAEEWEALMRSRGAPLPLGFRVLTTSLEFQPREMPLKRASMNLGAIVATESELSCGAVYTSNALAGAPVVIGRRAMASGGQGIRGVVVNNKVSNVRPSSGSGESDAIAVCEACASQLGITDGVLLPASTGVIGWALPVNEMLAAVSNLEESNTAFDIAAAMMTTDRYPKVSRAELAGGGTIVGVAKGSGMIEPELCATMLAFFMTDANLSPSNLQAVLERVCKRSLSSVGVDGDESTSDMALVLASGQVDCHDLNDFECKLGHVASQLAHHLVRNGEGTNHVIRLALLSELDADHERQLARDILNGPLFKCAVAGNDPNVGRLVAKLGQALSRLHRQQLLDVSPAQLLVDATVHLGDDVIFHDGDFQLNPDKEARINAHLSAAQLGPSDIGLPGKSTGDNFPIHAECVEIQIDLRPSHLRYDRPPTIVLGSDLTHQYVTENADYRS